MNYMQKNVLALLLFLVPTKTITEGLSEILGGIVAAGTGIALTVFGAYKIADGFSACSDQAALDHARELLYEGQRSRVYSVPCVPEECLLIALYDRVATDLFFSTPVQDRPGKLKDHFLSLVGSVRSAKRTLEARISAKRGSVEAGTYCAQGDDLVAQLADLLAQLSPLENFFRRYETTFKAKAVAEKLSENYPERCFIDPLAYARERYADRQMFPYGIFKNKLQEDASRLSRAVTATGVIAEWSTVQRARNFACSLERAVKTISASHEYLMEKQQEELHRQKERELRAAEERNRIAEQKNRQDALQKERELRELREQNALARQQARATSELADAYRREARAIEELLSGLRRGKRSYSEYIENRIAELEDELSLLKYSNRYNKEHIQSLTIELSVLLDK